MKDRLEALLKWIEAEKQATDNVHYRRYCEGYRQAIKDILLIVGDS